MASAAAFTAGAVSVLALVRFRAKARRGQKGKAATKVTLRIVNVTDVYMLDNFPSLKTLLAAKRAENTDGPTVSVLTGDFLAPYLLSSIDFGRGMMAMLNATPIDYVIWGNHEHDLPHRHCCARVRDYKGTWINTNMQSHETFAQHQVDHAVVEATSPDGTLTRRVAFLGLLTDQKSLYAPNAFGGATIDDPWKTARDYVDGTKLPRDLDLVVPLCHFYEPQDEITCRDFEFPLVLSGHDHHKVDRVIAGTRLVKAGSDAHYAAVVDLTWDASAPAGAPPAISVEHVKVSDYAPDAALQAAVAKAYAALDDLKHTQLTTIPATFRPLSSVGARQRNTTAGAFLCGQFRDAFNADAATPHAELVLMDGGDVRGGREYAEGAHFSMEALRSELHEKLTMCVLEMPGSVIEDAIREKNYHGPDAYFLQWDDGLEVDGATQRVVRVGVGWVGLGSGTEGAPFDRDRIYRVGYPFPEIFAENGPASIRNYFRAHPELVPPEDAARGGQEFLLQHWAHGVWRRVWAALDTDGDGAVDASEFAALDLDGDRSVSSVEMLKFMRERLGLDVSEAEAAFALYVLRAGGDRDRDGNLTWSEFQSSAGAQ